MALSKLFERIFWHNNTTPAINEDNLNAMSKAIDDIDDRVIALGADVMEAVPELQELTEELETMSQNPPYIGTNGNWYIWNTTTGQYEDSGVDASITITIADITMLTPTATPYVTNTGTNTDPIFHLFVPQGVGISSISKTSTSGLEDTYTITFTDTSTSTFKVTNGADGNDGVSPVVTISNITGGHRVVITDAAHPSGQSFDVMDGADGTDGDDGISPGITITTITGGHRVTITDATHPNGQSFDVMDGDSKEVKSQTLAANATSVTFTGIPTSGDYMIDFYTSDGSNYSAINTATAGQVTLTFDAIASARTVYCRIEEVS